MEYFISHLPAIFIAAVIVATAAVLYWYSLDKAARLKRQRMEARKAAAIKKRNENSDVK